jgi:hypothetical protein
MVKIARVLDIEPFELFKPAGAPPPAVSALLSKYNDEVIQAVSASLGQVYGYFQARLAEEFAGAGEPAGTDASDVNAGQET